MKSSLKLNLHSIAYPVTALGPGQRLVLWVSGCSLNCKGCISPELRSSNSGKQIKLDTLIKHILGLSFQLDGISLSGGEPFEQAEALSLLLIALRAARPDWSVLAFSGYSLAFLAARLCRQDRGLKNSNDLLAQLDILVDGPYLEHHSGEHPLIASSNQRLHYLSKRGRELRESCDALSMNHANLAIGNTQTQRLVGIIRPPERVTIHQKLNLSQPS